LMSWDASLNKDVDDCVARHVAATKHLDKIDGQDHPLLFCRSTPARQTKAYPRVLKGSPTDERIVEDCNRAYSKATQIIMSEHGDWCEKLERGNGHRAIGRTGGHGGKRKKTTEQVDQWWFEAYVGAPGPMVPERPIAAP